MVSAMIERLKSWLYGIKSDKLLHFICGLLIAQVLYALLSIGCTKQVSMLVALILATAVSIVKEIWDIKHGVPSWKDFIASEAGVIIGLLVMVLI